jgi:hypothetical protein
MQSVAVFVLMYVCAPVQQRSVHATAGGNATAESTNADHQGPPASLLSLALLPAPQPLSLIWCHGINAQRRRALSRRNVGHVLMAKD